MGILSAPEEDGQDRASFMGGHRQDGRAQGAGAVRSGLVLHARGFHGAANLPAQGTWSGCVQAQVRWTQAKGNVHGALHTSSGSIARHVLKQLESAGIVEMNEEGTGRKISEVGQRDLDVIAGSLPSAK